MATTEITTTVKQIAIEDVAQAYYGEQGCACGCGGEYVTPEQNLELVTKYLKKINARLKSNPEGVDANFNYASIEGDTRATRVYFKDNVSYHFQYRTTTLQRTEEIKVGA